MEQNFSGSHSANHEISQHFMELKASLCCSQALAIGPVLNQMNSIRPISISIILKLTYICDCIPCVFLPSGFLENLSMHFSQLMQATCACGLILFDLIMLIICGEEHKF